MIKFACPSGHQLTAPENLVGKAGKCPKCNAPIVVPTPDAAAAQISALSGGGPSGGSSLIAAGFSDVFPDLGSGKGKASTSEVFVFLCPNGHKLNGPPSLKGKPGQCPHCGARFIIPTDEDVEEMDEQLQDETPASDDDTRGGESVEQSEDFDRRSPRDGQPAQPPAGPSGLGYIVARLWERRSDSSELEIFLSEGEILAPDYYSESLSCSDYGVFAVQEGDGTLAITVVPWNSVRRVAVRRMDQLPGDLFQ
jgi:hypothetical protein